MARSLRRKLARGLLARATAKPMFFAALLLGLPTLLLPRALDDHWLHAHVTRTSRLLPALRPWWDLFSFYVDEPSTRFLRDVGVAPWWTDEAVRIRFFRPLTSLSHDADEWLGLPAAFAHAHSLLLFALVVAAATSLFGHVFVRRAPAAIASALFLVAASHGLPLAWISNRNALTATLGAVLAIRAHVIAIRKGSPPRALAAAAWMLAGLFAGEMALGAAAFVLAAEAHLARDSLRARAVRFAPHLAALAIWYATYRALGFGVRGSGMYLDPGADFGAWASAFPGRFAALAGSALSGLPAELASATPEAARSTTTALFAILGLAVLAGLGRTLVRDRIARFFALGTLLACVPGCGTFPSVRLLALASAGAAGLVATAIVAGGRSRSRAAKVGAWTLGVVHGPLALSLFALMAAGVPLLEGRLARASATMDELSLGGERCVVFVHAPMLVNGYLGAQRDTAGKANPTYTLTLGASERPLEVRAAQDAPGALRVDAPEGFYGAGDIGTLTRSLSRGFAPGATIEHPCGKIRVDAVSDRGIPTRILYVPHESGPMVRWVDARFVPVARPADGDVLRIDRAPPM